MKALKELYKKRNSKDNPCQARVYKHDGCGFPCSQKGKIQDARGNYLCGAHSKITNSGNYQWEEHGLIKDSILNVKKNEYIYRQRN